MTKKSPSGAFLRFGPVRDVLEIAGPAGDFASRILSGGRSVLTGDVGAGLLEMSPAAVRNAAKGADMAATGMYRDAKGYKVLDTNTLEAALKSIGFQPNSVATIQEAMASTKARRPSTTCAPRKSERCGLEASSRVIRRRCNRPATRWRLGIERTLSSRCWFASPT
jgi:hypothetical protein